MSGRSPPVLGSGSRGFPALTSYRQGWTPILPSFITSSTTEARYGTISCGLLDGTGCAALDCARARRTEDEGERTGTGTGREIIIFWEQLNIMDRTIVVQFIMSKRMSCCGVRACRDMECENRIRFGKMLSKFHPGWLCFCPEPYGSVKIC